MSVDCKTVWANLITGDIRGAPVSSSWQQLRPGCASVKTAQLQPVVQPPWPTRWRAKDSWGRSPWSSRCGQQCRPIQVTWYIHLPERLCEGQKVHAYVFQDQDVKLKTILILNTEPSTRVPPFSPFFLLPVWHASRVRLHTTRGASANSLRCKLYPPSFFTTATAA